MEPTPSSQSRRSRKETRTIGFRLPADLAQSVKAEAARRGIMLNRLFEEMWDLYRKSKSGKD
jgi:hypothetical protein